MISIFSPIFSKTKRIFSTVGAGRSGSVLIGLIVAMVIISSLIAAMIAQTATSSLNIVSEDRFAKAYYLAESGFRYAAAKLKHSGESALDTLHNHGSYSLGNQGSFTIQFETYLFEVDNLDVANELVTEVPFGNAAALTDDDVATLVPDIGEFFYVKIGDNAVQAVTNIVIQNAGGTPDPGGEYVKFTSTGSWSALKGERIKLAVKSNGEAVDEGENLNLQATSPADAFPLYNGRFVVDNKTYRYQKRETDKLVGIYRVDGSWVAPALADGTEIVLQDFTKLHSTGQFGDGDMEISREIVYHIPLSVSDKVKLHDTFEDKSNWEDTSTLGAHEILTIGGDGALKVTGTGAVGSDEGSLIKFGGSDTNIDLERAHSTSGNFLSYDAQVKVGFDPSVPSTYMAGISFRQDAVAAGNSYGVSLVKGGFADGIPDVLVPYNNWPLVVLWQHKAGVATNWLAHKYLVGRPVYFSYDTESGQGGWTVDGLWNLTNNRSKSPDNAWYYGQPGIWNYNTGAANSGSLTSPDIDLSAATSATLSFWSWFETESGTTWDKKIVKVSIDGGTTWDDTPLYQVATPTESLKKWEQILIDLSAYIGRTVKIRFHFDTVDALLNNGEGWYIDDVTISGDFPVDETTIVVRVKEAASVSFNGGDATPIEDGDVVTQPNGARGTVAGKPILASGSWTAGGNATGIITLNNLSGIDFVAGALFVDGTELATATVNPFRPRDNYIKVYYGEKNGYGTPNNTPLDYKKHGNPRGEIHWPPDEITDTTADNDYFTLVQWDDWDFDDGEEVVSSLDEPDAVIRTNTLTTPTSGAFSASEIGLHTFGINSTDVYFDDFAIQVEIPTTTGFLPAIQE